MRQRDPILENLENLQEDAVLVTLKRQLNEVPRPRVCPCPKCYVDMVALALNALPPRYVADRFNKFGDTVADEAAAKEQVEGAVRLAINKVAGRPHH
jgi:competence protein ComFB